MPSSELAILSQIVPGGAWPVVALVTMVIAVGAVATLVYFALKLRREHRAAVRAESRVRLMLDQMSANLWTTDNELRFTSLEGAAQVAMREAMAKLIGTSLYDFFKTRDRSFVPIAAHEDAVRDHKSTSYDVAVEGRIYHARVDPLKDEAGNYVGVIGASFDVTEWRKAEQGRQAAEAKSRALLVAIPDVMFRMRSDGTILEYIDKLTGPALGGSGRHVRLIYPDVADELLARARDALRTGEVQVYEHECAVRSAGPRAGGWFEGRFVVSGKDEVLVIVRNITERKKADADLRQREAELRSLVRALPDLLFLMTTDGRMAGVSAHDESDLLLPADELIGRHFAEFLPPAVAAQYDEHHRRALQIPGPQVFQYPLDIAGQTKWFEARMVFAGAESSQVLTLVRNITDSPHKRPEPSGEAGSAGADLVPHEARHAS
ncbi:MAG TPA: PAS domain-containing protein [Tepidisphaeraceae bacterium]|nr:PAS domain-containing protein [Tepidisphaeraceae bacterium]